MLQDISNLKEMVEVNNKNIKLAFSEVNKTIKLLVVALAVLMIFDIILLFLLLYK